MPIVTNTLPEKHRAERKLLRMYVDVSRQTGTFDPADAVWEKLGVGVEDAAIEKSFDEETVTDIWGVTETVINKVTKKITIDPNSVKGGQMLVDILNDIDRREAWGELSTFPVLTIRDYFGGQADIYDASTVKATSEGGSAYVDMPLDVTLGGAKLLGKATGTIDEPVFVKDV